MYGDKQMRRPKMNTYKLYVLFDRAWVQVGDVHHNEVTAQMQLDIIEEQLRPEDSIVLCTKHITVKDWAEDSGRI
jgi:hypothetical protein